MPIKKTQEKLSDVLKKIRESIRQEKYIFTNHALERVKERGIDIQTTINVLLSGHEEKQKTRFDKDVNSWKYAIRGTTVDEDDIRIIVAFDDDDMLIITVMYVM